MADTTARSGEAKMAEARVVFVPTVSTDHTATTRLHTATATECGLSDNWCGQGMHELPGRLDIRNLVVGGLVASGDFAIEGLEAEVVVLVQHCHIRQLPLLIIGARQQIGVDARVGDGCEVSSVGGGYTDTVFRVQDMLNAIQTFRTELVVCETTEEFGDKNVDFAGLAVDDGASPGAHIRLDDCDALVPEGVGGVAALEEDVSVRVLFDGPLLDRNAGAGTSL